MEHRKHCGVLEIVRLSHSIRSIFTVSLLLSSWCWKDHPSVRAHAIRIVVLTGLIKGISSIVVDHLRTFFQDPKVAITCIYCNYKEQTTQTVSNLIASLLKQMVQDSSTLSEGVKEFYDHHQKRDTHPTLENFTEMLEEEIGMYSKVFIVVDALDECPESRGTRADLSKVLRSLPRNVNLMVTSRDLSSIARSFHETKRLDIRADDQDVRKYLESRISSVPRRHLKALQDTIVNEIIKNVRGM